MRVLVLHQHYWPEIAATAQVLTDLCEDLVAGGHEVTVVTGQPSYRERATLASDEVHEGVHVRRVTTYAPTERTIARRLLHYGVYFGASLTEAVATRPSPDVALIMTTPPLLLGVSATLLRALRGVPFVYSVQDLYPDVAIDLGVLRRGPLATTIDVVATQLYRRAAALVTLSPGMRDKLVAKGVPRERVAVVPNWADVGALAASAAAGATEYRDALGLGGRPVALYSGNVGLSQGLEHLVDAARHTKERAPELVWLVAGDGNARASIERRARDAGLDNVRFLPPQPRARLGALLGTGDVGLVTMRRGVADDMVPSKLYGILAAGRPVVASVESASEVARVVREERVGAVVPPEDPVALAEAVSRLVQDRAALDELGARARALAESTYDRRVCTTRYREILEAVVERRRGVVDLSF
ncbi:MAG: glycosyltransferase family 4 protein [Deltaproteobacteria bacterium]|nr:glycosyltransferase family 4 protein [Deltaproteobacteria bacterium]